MDASQETLKRRWDNVGHFPALPNFPHHVHVEDEARVEPGISMSIIELIAVIALRNDLILLTTDQDFRTVPRLEQENWLAV